MLSRSVKRKFSPHHRHVREREEPYRFTTPEQLWDDFVTEVETVLRGEL